MARTQTTNHSTPILDHALTSGRRGGAPWLARASLMYFDLITLDRARFGGLLVVPDVHAHPDALDAAATRARDEGSSSCSSAISSIAGRRPRWRSR